MQTQALGFDPYYGGGPARLGFQIEILAIPVLEPRSWKAGHATVRILVQRNIALSMVTTTHETF